MAAISKKEFGERMKKFQANIKAAGLDAALVHANEADMANVRYLTEYWPTFESAAVFVPAVGKPILLIGPESGNYAAGRSVLPTIEKMVEYRESADPDYPGISVAGFADIAKKAFPKGGLKKLGLVGYTITPLPVYDSLRRELPGVELVKADQTLTSLRVIKSETEMELMRKAFAISEKAVDAILAEAKPGMTELQLIGIAQREIYLNGGEYEGHALYCFCGAATSNAISRPTHNKLIKNEVIQLNIGARVGGYSSSVGLPFSFGPLPKKKKTLVEFGLKAHAYTLTLLKAGKPAAEVVREYEQWVKKEGFAKYMLYGPCHGIGMMEVERPWMESTSNYKLQENMTFQVDTFFHDGKDYGLRWENGVRIKKGGVEKLSQKYMKMVEL
jgi:Xaa-Pro aminopeptidase